MKSVERMSDARGMVRVIDPKARSLTVEGLVLMKTFEVADDALIATSDKPRAGLGDLKVGDEVEVLYEEQGAACIAHCIAHPGAVDASRMKDLKKAA